MIGRIRENSLNLPPGWQLIDQPFLSSHHTPLPPRDVLAYFDGLSPTWAEALSDDIPRRVIVDDLISKLSKSRALGESRVTVLLGAGSEGKSTALLQTAGALAGHETEWKVLWRERRGVRFPSLAQILQLPKSGTTWLIVSDDADEIAEDIFEAVVALRQERRSDIQFLLCCQDIDWKCVGVNRNRRGWDQHTHCYEEVFMRGFKSGRQEEDALRVVRGWQKYGADGMLALAGLTEQEAVGRLVRAAEMEARECKTEGAFYGAMLMTRTDRPRLEARIKSVTERLERKRVLEGRHNLLTPFIYIAAMHAEGFSHLTMKVLAETLGCSIPELDTEIIYPLEEETFVSRGGRRVLTRHMRVAQAAMKFLSGRRHEPEYYFEGLLRAASRIYAPETKDGLIRPSADYRPWKFWPNDFYKRGQRELDRSERYLDRGDKEAAQASKERGERQVRLGISLAKVLREMTPKDPRLINLLARMLRETGKTQESAELFRNSPEEARWERSFYHEWAMSEWFIGDNWEIKAWLCGVALSDDGVLITQGKGLESYKDRGRDITERVIVGLAALAKSFEHLYRKSGKKDRTFIEACGATSQLAERLDLRRAANEAVASKKAIDELQKYREISRTERVWDVNVFTALERFERGLARAGERQQGALPHWVKRASELRFDQLTQFLGVTIMAETNNMEIAERVDIAEKWRSRSGQGKINNRTLN